MNAVLPSAAQGKVVKIILIILSIIIIAVGLAFYFTSGVADAVRNELTMIKSGDVKAAYEETSAAFKQSTSLEQFTKIINEYPTLKDNKGISINERRIENGFGYVSGTLEGTDGSKMMIEFQLVKENDKWKIQGMNISSGIKGE